jgi:hypothetical protein
MSLTARRASGFEGAGDLAEPAGLSVEDAVLMTQAIALAAVLG